MFARQILIMKFEMISKAIWKAAAQILVSAIDGSGAGRKMAWIPRGVCVLRGPVLATICISSPAAFRTAYGWNVEGTFVKQWSERRQTRFIQQTLTFCCSWTVKERVWLWKIADSTFEYGLGIFAARRSIWGMIGGYHYVFCYMLVFAVDRTPSLYMVRVSRRLQRRNFKNCWIYSKITSWIWVWGKLYMECASSIVWHVLQQEWWIPSWGQASGVRTREELLLE